MGVGPPTESGCMGHLWGGAARAGAQRRTSAGRHRAGRVPGDGCSAQMGEERLSPGGGMCDRLAVPERTRHPAPAHDQAAAQGAGLEVHGGLGRHRGAIVAARGYRTGVGGFWWGGELPWGSVGGLDLANNRFSISGMPYRELSKLKLLMASIVRIFLCTH